MARTGLLSGTFASVAFSVVVGSIALPTAYAQEAVRPEIGKPLQAASALLKANKLRCSRQDTGGRWRIGQDTKRNLPD